VKEVILMSNIIGQPWYEIFKNKSGQYTFSLKASDDEIVATGGVFQEKQKCVYALHWMRQYASTANVKDISGGTNNGCQ
jgi:uncharacterized protein YegP (UPF0339 family)